MLINGDIPAFNALNQRLGLVNTVGYGDKEDPFPGKAGSFHIFIRRNDNAVRRFDLLRRKHIFCAAAAIGFGLEGQAELLARLFQGLRRHIGVCNTGRAGGNGKDAVAALFSGQAFFDGLCRCGGLLRAVFGLLITVNYREEGIGIPGCAQLSGEGGVHQQHHQVRENFQMYISVHRGGNHKE